MQQPPPDQPWQPPQGNGHQPTSYGQPPQRYRKSPSPYQPQQPYGNYPPPPPPKKKRRFLRYCLFTVAAIFIVFILLIVIGALIGNHNSAPSPSSGLSESDFKALSTDTTVDTLDKDGNQDKGLNVHFTCTIMRFVKDSNGNTAGANVDQGLTASVIQVAFPSGTDLNKLNTGDTLEVWGMDEGTFSGPNLFGATVQEVVVQAAYMTDQTTGYQTA